MALSKSYQDYTVPFFEPLPNDTDYKSTKTAWIKFKNFYIGNLELKTDFFFYITFIHKMFSTKYRAKILLQSCIILWKQKDMVVRLRIPLINSALFFIGEQNLCPFSVSLMFLLILIVCSETVSILTMH